MERQMDITHKLEVFEQLAKKIKAVKSEYPDTEIVPMVIIHYARPKVLQQVKQQGVIVAQGFEW